MSKAQKPIHFSFCFILIFSLTASAQNNYRALHWDVDDGLSNSLLNGMLKDANGFLWIATQSGLDRFDGNTIRNYFIDTNNTITQTNTAALKLIEDSLHNIWVGTEKGMARYDLKADSFSLFFPAPESKGHSILPMTATYNEVFCIEGFSQITKYNIHTLKKTFLLQLSPADNVYNGMSILSSYFDSASNCIWIPEGDYGTPGGGLYQISIATGAGKHYSWPCYRNIRNHSHWSEAMRFDQKRNAFWINSPDGLIEFTLRDKEFHRIEAMNEITSLKSYNRFVGIDLDCYGRVWLATDPKGILVYDPYLQKVFIPFSKDSVLQNNISNANSCLYCDRQNIIWSGFWLAKGLYQIIPFTSVIRQYASDSILGAMTGKAIINCVQATHENLWMGTADGLAIFDTHTEKFTVLGAKDLPGFHGDQIIPAGIDTIAKKAWLHSEKGLFEMDMITRNCKKIVFKDAAFKIIQHPSVVGPLWYGGYGHFKDGCIIPVYIDNKLSLFEIKSDSAIAHQIISEDSFYFQGTIVIPGKYIFLQTMDGNSITYSNQKGSWKKLASALDQIKRRMIFYSSSDSSYWIGTDRKLFHYYKNLNFIRSYTQNDGLPKNDMFSFIADNKGNVWFTTHGSISELNIATGKIITLSEIEGFKKQIFSTDAFAFKDVSGDLYFMTGIQSNQGFARIKPDKINLIYPPSIAYIQSIELNQSNLNSYKVIKDQGTLTLNYFENNISIKTGVVDYFTKGNNLIRYKLEGLDNSWEFAPANYIIRYDGLPYLQYKLTIQAANAAGEFNGPYKTLDIRIRAPFWRTWWFYTLIGIIISMGIYKIFHFQLKQKMKIFNVRQKLHRDLHDDVGATLSSIKVYSEILEEKSANPLITNLIKNNAVEMIDKLEIIAWATNPYHDTFKSFKDMITKHTVSICHAKKINLNIKVDGVVDNMVMPGDIRQNLTLICKEGINNVIKHSDASECNISISIKDRHFSVTITDNGNGFYQGNQSTGNGIKNIQKRIQELNGKITIQSEPGKGTVISFYVNIPFQNARFMG